MGGKRTGVAARRRVAQAHVPPLTQSPSYNAIKDIHKDRLYEMFCRTEGALTGRLAVLAALDSGDAVADTSECCSFASTFSFSFPPTTSLTPPTPAHIGTVLATHPKLAVHLVDNLSCVPPHMITSFTRACADDIMAARPSGRSTRGVSVRVDLGLLCESPGWIGDQSTRKLGCRSAGASRLTVSLAKAHPFHTVKVAHWEADEFASFPDLNTAAKRHSKTDTDRVTSDDDSTVVASHASDHDDEPSEVVVELEDEFVECPECKADASVPSCMRDLRVVADDLEAHKIRYHSPRERMLRWIDMFRHVELGVVGDNKDDQGHGPDVHDGRATYPCPSAGCSAV